MIQKNELLTTLQEISFRLQIDDISTARLKINKLINYIETT